jgi:hypothetical protein
LSLTRGSWISLFAMLMIFIGPLISQSMPMDQRASAMTMNMSMDMSMDMSAEPAPRPSSRKHSPLISHGQESSPRLPAVSFMPFDGNCHVQVFC